MMITIKINAAHLDIVDEFLTSNDIDFETIMPKLTKGQMIMLAIVNVVESGEFVSRKDIAKSLDCTVSRISEITKEHSTNEFVIAYNAMAAAEKAKAKNARELAHALSVIEAAQKLIDAQSAVVESDGNAEADVNFPESMSSLTEASAYAFPELVDENTEVDAA